MPDMSNYIMLLVWIKALIH